MLYTPKDYQRDAIDDIKEDIQRYMKRGIKRTVVFRAPTGSGKTFIAASVIEELVAENIDEPFCFVWASIGTGELQKQSYDSVKSYMQGNPTCSLLEDAFFGSRDYIKKHEVVFVNWEKLVSKDRVTGKWINNLMKDQEGTNFIKVLENTRTLGTKIILIVDESHIGANAGTRIAEFKDDIIKPNVVLEMSATPQSEPDVIVDVQRVIDEGMIKEAIVVNEGIRKEHILDVDKDSEILILEHAEAKRQELIAAYAQKAEVNPLVLVQIPNVDAGEAKKIVVRDFLRNIGITEENGKLKFWCDGKDYFDKKAIKRNDDETCYLVFKTAVATGWDCPRAHVLVKFREGHSETFEIQTIGRILRTAEAQSYQDTVLDNAYIFTNIREFETKQNSYNPNRIKTEFSYIKHPYDIELVYNQTRLTSYYRSRQGDYNSADSRFTAFFERSFMQFFNLQEKDKGNNYSIIENKLAEKGLKIKSDKPDSIIAETHIGSFSIDFENSITGDQVSVRMADNDIQAAYYQIIKENLNGLAFVRSRSPINSAIIEVFSEFYNAFSRCNKVSEIQKIVVYNRSIFVEILHNATREFKSAIAEMAGRKGIEYDFYIQDKRAYSIETHKQLPSIKSLYQPLYVLIKNHDTGAINDLEKEFIHYLDTEGNESIEWFWQNGQEHMQINFGISYNNGANAFQPDFIVKFKNGIIGIFDTKASGQNVSDTKVKAEALYKYMEEENEMRIDKPKLIGGIVMKQGSQFFYYNESEYHDIAESDENWHNFNELLRNVQ